MEFQCRLGTEHGQIIEGIYVADSEGRLRRELEEKGYFVLAVRRKGGLALPGISLPVLGRRRRVSTSEFVVFNQELATLLKAGMPLAQSLDILRQKVPNPTFKAVLDDVHEKVRSGVALSDAFAAHEDLFPPIYTASLLAGEKSGSLDQVLRRFIAYMRMIGNLRRNTVSALIYPAVLLGLSVITVFVIIVRVIPAFSGFYETFDAELPFATRVLISISDTVAGNLPIFLLIIGALAAVGIVSWRRPATKLRWHAALLRAPLIGPVATKFATTQFARTLATLLGGGIPLVSALEVSARAVGNRHVGAQVGRMVQEVREGQSLAHAMAGRDVFPDVALKMVEVGEATGALQEMLNAVADFFDEDIETTLGRFTRLVEPLMLVIMAVVIAAILLALYLPVFQLSSAIG
ncbi:MAG TPA: type II secretion system F family protein [Vicinamibacterales bacterium]